jgi:hypothetical protein
MNSATGQVSCPVVRGAVDPERVFEAVMEPLHQAIGLQMVSLSESISHAPSIRSHSEIKVVFPDFYY